MRASLIKSHGGTPQLWSFHGCMLELRHSVIIQMYEAISIFYHKWMEIEAKQELSKYLIMDLIGKQRNTWDIGLAKLFHLTDPE